MDLFFQSKNISLHIEKFQSSVVKFKDNIIISESYVPGEKYGDYQITIKKNVDKREQLSETAKRLYDLANSISNLITYVIGFPITTVTQDFYGSNKQILIYDNIKGWETNFKKIEQELIQKENPEQKCFATFAGCSMTRWATIEKAPLSELITIIGNYNRLDDITKNLIRFHTLALHHEYDVKYLILGKTLEIAMVLLPIPNNTTKSFLKLPQEMREVFKNRTISWLYEMSNSRFETRHAINKKKDSNLHVYMSDDEYSDFMLLSDLLINFLVRKKLNLEPLIWETY